MEHHFLISIVIPVYNTELYLSKCIKSIQDQTYKYFECLIIDDGSEDGSHLIAQSFCNVDVRFKLFRQKNSGLSSARNKGIEHAKGHFIAFLDSDDFWMPEKLLNQINALSKNYYFDSVVFSRGVGLLPSGVIFNDNLNVFNNNPLELLSRNSVDGSGSSILIPKNIIDKIGFFNESLRSFEDLEYWFRIAINGYKFVFVDSADVIMTQRSNSLRKSKKGMQLNNLLAFKLQLNAIPIDYSFLVISKYSLKRFQFSRKYCERNKIFSNFIYLFKIAVVYIHFTFDFILKKLKFHN